MEKKRVVLHADCNSFYASVESVKRPELKEVPMAVAGNPESRHGIILAKNELAKKFNIKT
ncbi:MAG: DNA polymerase IV, partial [Clostridia bacterium]|nr:DNA polymerase IV [Clostridia bacterium]